MKFMVRVALGTAWLAAGLWAQGDADRLLINFRDPSRPGTVKVSILQGSISVKTHAGKEVFVEMAANPSQEREREVPESARGLRRLNSSGSSLTVEEENNVVTVSTGWRNRAGNLVVTVPVKTSLKLNTTNGKTIQVEGVDGEMELNATNGNIQLTDVSGSAVAHSMNGKITAKFKRVDEGKPMSFSSYNGTVDVTLPAGTKANLKMQTQNGEVYTDFDVQMQPNQVKREELAGDGDRPGRKRIRHESMSVGAINGGGPDFTFKNYNGSIYIRKAN